LAVTHRLPIVVFMSMSLVLMLLDRAEANVFDEAREAITDVTAPIFEALSPPINWVREKLSKATQILDIYDENERLREENRRLLAWKEAALQLEHQNARLEALLNVQLDPAIEYITGRVVTDTGGPFVQMFMINIGSRDGVVDGQAVIDEDGLVGRVLGAGHSASRVLLLSDLNSRVPVLVEPSNYRAVLVGDNEAQPKLEFLPRTAQVRVGDRVVTSGHGGQLPPGLPVGIVSEVGRDEIRIQTFAHDARVEMVRILNYDFPDPDEEVLPQEETAVDGSAQ
jgi:rod shape-determining protein MreC